jgi:soluble lytic murein transglycosylase-like protein
MGRRVLVVLLGMLALAVLSLPTTSNAIESCQQYDDFFEEASGRYDVPSNLLRAIALTESNCNQDAYNENDGGCGIMQLTAETRAGAAVLLGVSEAALCENTSESARLNILGGAAVLDSFKCWANPRVVNTDDFNRCSQGDNSN